MHCWEEGEKNVKISKSPPSDPGQMSKWACVTYSKLQNRRRHFLESVSGIWVSPRAMLILLLSSTSSTNRSLSISQHLLHWLLMTAITLVWLEIEASRSTATLISENTEIKCSLHTMWRNKQLQPEWRELHNGWRERLLWVRCCPFGVTVNLLFWL